MDGSRGLEELVKAVGSPVLEPTDQALAVALYRALAEGMPVTEAVLARRCGLEEVRVAATLGRWPVSRDDAGAVNGFWGLSLAETDHGYVSGGRQLYAWCAWDTLFLPVILGQDAEVRSRCPVTQVLVSLAVGPGGVRRADPAGSVVSFLSPERPWAGDVVETFCCYVRFLASPAAGAGWVRDHPGTFLLGFGDAFELGRRVIELRFGAPLPAEVGISFG